VARHGLFPLNNNSLNPLTKAYHGRTPANSRREFVSSFSTPCEEKGNPLAVFRDAATRPIPPVTILDVAGEVKAYTPIMLPLTCFSGPQKVRDEDERSEIEYPG
jgi:hypothetical protein